MSELYIRRGGGRPSGPVDTSQLQALIANGKVIATDEMAVASDGPWVPLTASKFTFPKRTEAQSEEKRPSGTTVAQTVKDKVPFYKFRPANSQKNSFQALSGLATLFKVLGYLGMIFTVLGLILSLDHLATSLAWAVGTSLSSLFTIACAEMIELAIGIALDVRAMRKAADRS